MNICFISYFHAFRWSVTTLTIWQQFLLHPNGVIHVLIKKKKPGKLELLIFGDGDGKGIPISSP